MRSLIESPPEPHRVGIVGTPYSTPQYRSWIACRWRTRKGRRYQPNYYWLWVYCHILCHSQTLGFQLQLLLKTLECFGYHIVIRFDWCLPPKYSLVLGAVLCCFKINPIIRGYCLPHICTLPRSNMFVLHVIIIHPQMFSLEERDTLHHLLVDLIENQFIISTNLQLRNMNLIIVGLTFVDFFVR